MIHISKKYPAKKRLIKGKFYFHNDKGGGHPSYIYEKNDNKDLYKAIQFTHEKKSNRTKLKHNIDPNGKGNSYVVNNPFIDSSDGFGRKELDRFRIHKEDKPLINKIKRKK